MLDDKVDIDCVINSIVGNNIWQSRDGLFVQYPLNPS